MSYKGSCLQTYIPVRKEPKPSAEMVTSLIFGESYSVDGEENGFLHIVTDFDSYSGWISANSYAEYREYTHINEHIFIEARGEHQIMFIPCGAQIPENGNIEIDGEIFKPERKLKTYHHLPLPLRLQKLAMSFMNMPYLWGGRTFMGIDCSGFTQIIYKANGYAIPRDTGLQINFGKKVSSADAKPGDLVFFSKPDADKVVHVGMLMEKELVIHASAKVRTDKLHSDGLHINGKLEYRLIQIQRII